VTFRVLQLYPVNGQRGYSVRQGEKCYTLVDAVRSVSGARGYERLEGRSLAVLSNARFAPARRLVAIWRLLRIFRWTCRNRPALD
jgi:hypothetical protein